MIFCSIYEIYPQIFLFYYLKLNHYFNLKDELEVFLDKYNKFKSFESKIQSLTEDSINKIKIKSPFWWEEIQI